MTHVPAGHVVVACPGRSPAGYVGYNAHANRLIPYMRAIPFIDAIHRPPYCETHDRPYLTEGGQIVADLLEHWAERGVEVECRSEGGYCIAHGRHDHRTATGCRARRIAAWMGRRYEYHAEQE